MERLSDTAIDIINDLHTERLEYTSEYIPLIDSANKLAKYEDLEEQGGLLRLPCKVGEAVDKLFSHNEVVALWYDKPSDKNHSYLLWRGMAHQIPKEYKENRILKFKGIIPERFSESDTINLLITPYVIPCEEAEAKLKELERGEKE